MNKIIQLKLKMLAKMVLAKYKPKIIGITGSIGKTSTKDAVYTVLAGKFNVRRNIKNYNNEIGLPLTILGFDSPGRNIFGWLFLFFKAFGLIVFRDNNYPKILVLEMGVDRPGDMSYLNSIAKADIGVVTFIGPVHLEYFGSIDKIKEEKGKLIKNIDASGWAIINYDNEKARQLANKSQAKVLKFGLNEGADIRAQEVVFSFAGMENFENNNFNNLSGITFKLSYKGSFVPVHLPNVLGQSAVYAALGAAAVGVASGLNLLEISEALNKFDAPKGRMNIIPGIKKTLIIDDTYNSSPQAVISALEVIKEIPINPGARKVAVLGDMFELGSISEESHIEVGRYLVKCGVVRLVAVGARSLGITRGAKEAGMSEDHIFHFDDSQTAGEFVKGRIKSGDLVFVKGSQGMRMEKVVKEIMAEPQKAGELLVRQNEEWLNR